MSVQNEIHTKLRNVFNPDHLEVINESNQHNVPAGSESHFKVVLVSNSFEAKRQVARHQSIYAALADQLSGPVHALALHTYSPQEWAERQGVVPASPECLGGSKSEVGAAE